MDLRFLETFVAVADCGSIAGAARRLNLTPAALAQRLRALESDLGRPLVQRVGRHTRPTAAGDAVLIRARPLLEAARDLRAAAAQDVPAGQLRLGAIATALTSQLPAVLEDMRTRWPEVDYFIRPGSSVDLYHAVIEGELDAALILRPPFAIPKSAGFITLRSEPLVLVVPQDLAGQSVEDLLKDQPFIRYDRNQWGGQLAEKWLRSAGFAPRDWLELDALDAILALVSRGLGVSVLPDFAPPWPEGLQVARLPLPGGMARDLGLLCQSHSTRAPAISAFREACLRCA
ncbi:LysR family transcriptional regulator [Falsigemmobacter faecalis]|uniref:LysR family transcriptional regulator n=1 Tax=Falsigemmobacter faecalis TaxID=2488730 RepID=A0A3P3DNU7_9RHOB|nr:LysR family transcriptional regulator [Falsigemmobacter faecalis]RRH74308.1 LysR family transcriptional regulator [Falsigemmobacter faecalis]